MSYLSTYLARFLVALSILLVSFPAFGADWDRFPELEGRHHVGIKKRFDGPLYDQVRECYRRYDSRVGAEYFAAMVDVTDASGSRSRKKNDAGPYAEALFEAWKEQKKLDADEAVLVVLGLRNRSVAVYPGERWRKIGFEGPVLEETLEAAHVKKYQRRGKYVEALCSVVHDIDLRLSSLQREMEGRIAQLKERLPSLDAKLGVLTEQVDGRFATDRAFGEELREKLATAREQLDEARELVEAEPAQSVNLADKVEAVLLPVQKDLSRFDADIAVLDGLEKDLAALEEQIQERPDADWEQPQVALAQLEKCEQKASDIRNAYEGRPWQVRDCMREAEAHLARGDVHYFYLRTVLPAIAAALLAMLLMGFVAVRRLRRKRAMRPLEADLAEWNRRLNKGAERLDQVIAHCPYYFGPGRTLWKGDSANLDAQVSDATNRISLMLAKGRELVEQAEALRDASHALDAKRLERALALLRETTVEFEAGRIHPHQQLEMPLTEPFSVSAHQLMADVDDALIEVHEHLDEVVDVVERQMDATWRADDAVGKATRAVEQRRALGLDALHLAEPLTAALTAWRQAKRLAKADPARAAGIFERAAAQLEQIAELAETGNEVVRQVQGPIAEMGDEMEQQTLRLRFARINMTKLSFDPREELERAKRKAVECINLVAQAREDEARDALAELQAMLDKLAEQLDTVADARDHVPTQLEEIAERRKELKDRLLVRRYSMRLLASNHDEQVFEDEAERLNACHTRLTALPDRIERVAEHHAAGRYLVAAAKILKIEHVFEATEELLTELEHLEHDVEKARQLCHDLVKTVAPRLRHLQGRAKIDGVSDTLRTLVAEQAVSFQIVRDQVRVEQVDWFDARDELIALHEVLGFLAGEVDIDLDAAKDTTGLDETATREYRQTQVELITYRPPGREVASPSSLGEGSSWADSVATLDEPAVAS